MAKTRIIVAALVALTFLAPAAVAQLLDDHVWRGGTGTQQWQVNGNWNPAPFPNDPGRVDPDMTVISPVVGANVSVNLAADLNVDVGATDVTVAGLTIGSASGAVTTNITSSGAGRLVFENFELTNTIPEPDECPFNCGAALITSQGVAGATNTISAIIGVHNDDIHVAGTKDITLSGGLQEIDVGGSLSALPTGQTVFITGTITTNDTGVEGGAEDTPLALNDSQLSQGTIDVTGTITGTGRMRYGTQDGTPNLPMGSIILRNNNYSGRTIIGRGNVILAHDNALGTGDVKEEGPAAGSLETGYNLISNNDNRTIANEFILAQWQTVKGENSLKITGRQYQTNARGWINMLSAGKTLTLSGQQYTFELADGEEERVLTFDGSGKTIVTGGVRNRWDADLEVEANTTFLGSLRKRGSGVLIIDGDNSLANSDSNFTGSIYVQGGNLHFATNADLGAGAQVASEAGAVGVDSGVINNTSFLGLLTNSSNPTPDVAGLLVVFDRGGLMLSIGEYGMNLDFTGAHVNAASMSLAAHEGGSSYTGTITPAAGTYRFGGGSGTLTLPNANQLTSGNSVVVTNGGVVNITGSNNYTGTTSVVAKYVTTLERAAAEDTIAFDDDDIINNDQIYLGTILTATTLANGGSPSSIGSSSPAAGNLYIQGSTLRYVGAGANSDRLFTIGSGGATIDASGTGALTLTNAGALAIDVAEARTGNVNSFATGNGANDRATIRNIPSTEDLQPGMPVTSPGLPLTGDGAGVPAGTVITRIVSPNDVMISNPVGNFAFYNNTPITFGAAPERKLTLAGTNTGNNTLAPLVQNASDGGIVGLTKEGTGKWIVTGNNTYTGATTVETGTLLINGNQTGNGPTTVAAGATLGGSGTLGGGLANNGTVNAGTGIGTLSVNGNVTMAENSHFLVELSGTTSDKLAITGNLDLSATGNFLDVTGIGSGTSWVIGTFTGTLLGTFETITPGYSVTYGTNQITLNASGTPGVPGDYNNNGVVDAADYVLWRKGGPLQNEVANPGSVTAQDYIEWRARFGRTSGAGSGNLDLGGAVPEPATIWIMLSAIGVTICLKRSRG